MTTIRNVSMILVALLALSGCVPSLGGNPSTTTTGPAVKPALGEWTVSGVEGAVVVCARGAETTRVNVGDEHNASWSEPGGRCPL